MGSRSDLRTRGIIDRILCDTLRQKLTHPLKFLWASHVFPGQGLRIWAGCRSSAGRHSLPEAPLSPTTMRICCPRESPSSLCDWPVICSPPDTALWTFLIHYFYSLHSLTKQTSLGHPLCARHFREVMRIKLAFTSKKADAQEMRHTHSELWLWYMQDMRKCLQRLSRKYTNKHQGKDFPETMTIKLESGRWEEIC